MLSVNSFEFEANFFKLVIHIDSPKYILVFYFDPLFSAVTKTIKLPKSNYKMFIRVPDIQFCYNFKT